METNSNELNALIESKQNQARPITPTTQQKYKQTYNYLTESLKKSGDWITDASSENLVKIINKLDMKNAGKLLNLNLFIMIRKNTLDIQTLIDLRTKLSKKLEQDTKQYIQHKRETLPSYKIIVKYIDELYKDKKYTDFLINYLIFTYGLRNKDVNLTIITNENYKNVDIAKNYLIIRKTDCILIVNDYKTSSTYGVKKIAVRSRRVLDCANKLREGPILVNKFNEPVNDGNISYYINLYENLNESDLFKIHLLHIQTLPNPIKELAKICYTRGSCNITAINNHYNIA
jgi:hypothetical protein